MLEGLRGEDSIAELCRREGIFHLTRTEADLPKVGKGACAVFVDRARIDRISEPVRITVALRITGYALSLDATRGPGDAGSARPAAGPRHPRPRRLRSPPAAV